MIKFYSASVSLPSAVSFQNRRKPFVCSKKYLLYNKNDYYMTYLYSNINRSHYDSTAEQQSKEITTHKIYFTAIFEYITQQALRCLGFYQVGKGASSETQGQLVGSIKCSWWKFTVRSRRAPGHLLLPNQFQKRLNCLLLIDQKKFFWPISEEKLPGDSRVFLHDVVCLIDRQSCVARSTGKVSRGKFQNKMVTTRKNYNL